VEISVDGVPAFVGRSALEGTGPRAGGLTIAITAFAVQWAILGIWDAPPHEDLTVKLTLGAGILALTALNIGWGLRAFTRAGRIVLWPDRLCVAAQAMPWHELLRRGPRPPSGRRARLRLSRTTMPWIGGLAGWNRDLSTNPLWTAVDPAYLADVIRYYVEHPEYRERIGQPGEQERLHQAIMELRATTAASTASASR
jgi:hypothetical protein